MTTTCVADSGMNETESIVPVERAIISVSDKTGLAQFARQLAEQGVELFSTGGTRRHLLDHDIEARDIADYTGFPEMMDGRVKTLHPRIFGGILCRRDHAADMQSTEEHSILRFDLVVVNLYPFAETVARPGVTRATAIENIDIGGPSLVRAAAKNSRFVAIATSPAHYATLLEEIRNTGGTSRRLRDRLMADAFAHTARYDRMIADWFAPEATPVDEQGWPEQMEIQLLRRSELRYGENPQQTAALYETGGASQPRLPDARQLHGKELSFNNWLDLNAALVMASSLAEPGCVVIKHNNPCGAAIGPTLPEAVQQAINGDPQSAFGSILGLNRPVDEATASLLASGEYFIECILAPGFEEAALRILTTVPKWKKNVRLLQSPLVNPKNRHPEIRQIQGGMLVQQADSLQPDTSTWNMDHASGMDADLRRDLEFAWNMVRFVKSNAIVLAAGGSLCGVGAGQMSRVDSVRIAIDKAGERAHGSVLASDAFFPFADSIQTAADAGIRAIIQPGGSMRDDEVIAAARQHGIPMVLTGRRHFLH